MKSINANRLLRQSAVWCLFAVLAALSNVAWAAAGYVHELTGDVSVQQGAAAARSVKMGDTFDPGATFRTSANGKAVIKFEDGQIVSLQPNSAFRVDGYSFNVNNPKAGSSAMRLLQGAMRYVTGIIGSTNHNNIKLAAGTATIGIRGTDVNVLVDQTTQAVLAMIAAGAVVLETPGGTTAVGVGQYASYVAGTVPTSAPIASAPASARAIVAALQAAPIPVNTPVIVQAAAAAATAVATARAAQAVATANPGNPALAQAAAAAAAEANTAIQTAVAQAQTALQTAIASGAVPVTAPATPTAPQTVVPPAAAAQQAAAAAAAVAPAATVQAVNVIIATPPTPPPTLCGASPC